MHYSLLVILNTEERPNNEDEIDTLIEAAMLPFKEYSYESDKEKWDWWDIGGRWTGVYSDYDPQKDPQNWNADGKLKHPTAWIERTDIDVFTVEHALKLGHKTFAVLTPDGEWHEEDYDILNWDLRWESILEPYKNNYAVVVDYHA